MSVKVGEIWDTVPGSGLCVSPRRFGPPRRCGPQTGVSLDLITSLSLPSLGSLVDYVTVSVTQTSRWLPTYIEPCPPQGQLTSWWRHQMETFSTLLALCAGNSLVTGEFPSQRPVTRSFDVFFDLCMNKRLSKHSWGWWFETLPCSLWRHCNETLVFTSTTHPRWVKSCFGWVKTFGYHSRICDCYLSESSQNGYSDGHHKKFK